MKCAVYEPADKAQRGNVMQNRSDKIKRKIRTCAGLTGRGTLVAAASIGLASKGYGALVTIQLDDHISPNSQLSYDLDGDGELDVSFLTGTVSDLFITGTSMKAEFLPLSGCTYGACGSIIRYDSLGYYLVQAHQPGELISGTFEPCSGGGSQKAWLTIGSSGPFFEPTSPRFAGFSFVKYVAGDTLAYNGWAELEVTESQPGVYELNVIALGYETEPFTPVPAGGVATAVTGTKPPASGLSLQAAPNPFNTYTQIEFKSPRDGTGKMRIYDVAGKLVRNIGQTRIEKGLNSVIWDAKNDAGFRVPSGVYFFRLEAFGSTHTRKMVLVD